MKETPGKFSTYKEGMERRVTGPPPYLPETSNLGECPVSGRNERFWDLKLETSGLVREEGWCGCGGGGKTKQQWMIKVPIRSRN